MALVLGGWKRSRNPSLVPPLGIGTPRAMFKDAEEAVSSINVAETKKLAYEKGVNRLSLTAVILGMNHLHDFGRMNLSFNLHCMPQGLA